MVTLRGLKSKLVRLLFVKTYFDIMDGWIVKLFGSNGYIDEMEYSAEESHLYLKRCVVRLKGERSKPVRFIFVQTCHE